MRKTLSSLPERRSNQKALTEAVRKGLGGMFLPFERCLELTGADRVAYLQGLVTNDVQALKEGEGCYAASLVPEGRMVSDLRIYALEDRLLLLVKASAEKALLSHLDQYHFMEDVQVRTLQDRILTVQGPLSRTFLSGLFGGVALSNQPESHREIPLDGIEIRAFCHSHTGEEGYDLLIPPSKVDTVYRLILEKGKAAGWAWIDEETFHRLRIEAGIPFFGVDMTASTIPVEAGLETSAISYTKGCYIGQEVIAKIKYIGHANRTLTGFKARGGSLPPDGKVLVDEKEVGWLTSSTFSFHLGCPVALGYLRREVKKPGESVAILAQTGTFQAQIQELPFYRRPS